MYIYIRNPMHNKLFVKGEKLSKREVVQPTTPILSSGFFLFSFVRLHLNMLWEWLDSSLRLGMSGERQVCTTTTW
jgi:hypothetical protein